MSISDNRTNAMPYLELDYLQEAENAAAFSAQVKETPLSNVVFTPGGIPEYTTTNILVTEWVDGQRLDETRSEDVTKLCSIAMNTYLTMLLEFGVLRKQPLEGVV